MTNTVTIDPRDYMHILDESMSMFEAMRAIRKVRKLHREPMNYRVNAKDLRNALRLCKFKDEL